MCWQDRVGYHITFFAILGLLMSICFNDQQLHIYNEVIEGDKTYILLITQITIFTKSAKLMTVIIQQLCVTGDIAFRFMDYSPLGEREVTICDANASMLCYGQKKAAKQGYTRGRPSLLSNYLAH